MTEFPTVRVAAIQATPLIGGPLYGEEGMVLADCDLRVGLRAKRSFDAAGHYSRHDVLAPLADRD